MKKLFIAIGLLLGIQGMMQGMGWGDGLIQDINNRSNDTITIYHNGTLVNTVGPNSTTKNSSIFFRPKDTVTVHAYGAVFRITIDVNNNAYVNKMKQNPNSNYGMVLYVANGTVNLL